MIAKHKYNVLFFAVIVLFGYVLATDVWERTVESYAMSVELKRKGQTLLEPEQMVERKVMLLRRRMQLAHLLSNNIGTYTQSQTGVFEFLTTSAQHLGVSLESLIPLAAESRGLREVGFKLRVRSDFHKAARFVNTIENGPFGISLRKLDISSENQRRPLVVAAIEGVAFIMHQ